jgi:hypothetical protein
MLIKVQVLIYVGMYCIRQGVQAATVLLHRILLTLLLLGQ